MAKYLPLIQYLIVIALFSSNLADKCEQKSSCLCQFSDDSYIDISNIFKNNNEFLVANSTSISVYYHGCNDATPKINFTNLTRTTCNEDLAICIVDYTSGIIERFATNSISEFKEDGNDIVIVYNNKSTPSSVKLICTPGTQESNLLLHDYDNKQHNFRLFSPHACRIHPEYGLSTGSKLLIMFFTFTSIYLVGGALIAYFLKGARGREVIPNIDFWTRLPGLVKDGAVYLMSGCRPQMVTTSDTYDQI